MESLGTVPKLNIEGKEVLAVIYACDDNYVPFAGVSIRSMLDNGYIDKFYDTLGFNEEDFNKYINVGGLIFNVTAIWDEALSLAEVVKHNSSENLARMFKENKLSLDAWHNKLVKHKYIEEKGLSRRAKRLLDAKTYLRAISLFAKTKILLAKVEK